MNLRHRLRHLEQQLPDPGCVACRDRRWIVMVESQRQRDGSKVLLESLPAPCAACGQVPEFIVEIVRPYEEGRTLDNERLVPCLGTESAT